MSGIDNRNIPAGSPHAAIDTQGYGADNKPAVDDDSQAWTPGGKPAGQKGSGTGKAGEGKKAGGAKGADAAHHAKGAQPMALGEDPSVNSGVLGEKKRTGMAALAEPPPMPPSALRASPEHVQTFATINADMHEAQTRGLPANQPNLMNMHAEMGSLDQSTPQGQARAQQLEGRMVQAGGHQLSSLSSGDGLAAFLALAVGFQDKNKNIESRLNELTMKGRETAAKQEKAEHEAQAKAAEKAEKKAAAMKFLKPLLAILSVVMTVFTLGSATGVALACMGAVAGFIAGGVIGGKKNGTGFSFTAALEGAATGFGAAGMAGALKSILTKALELGSRAGASLGARGAASAGERIAQKNVALAIERGAEQSASGSTKLAELAKNTQTQAQKLAQNAEMKLGQVGTRAQEKLKDGLRAAGVREGSSVDNALVRAKDGFTRLKEGTRLEFGMRVADTAGQMVGATGQFLVDQQRAKATLHEAQAKLIKVIEECMKQQGERGQDAVQSIVNGRKAAFDNVEGVLKSRQQANANAISGIGR